jgi:hypothetical protein
MLSRHVHGVGLASKGDIFAGLTQNPAAWTSS